MASVNLILAGKVALEHGLTAIVDEEDFALVSKYRWVARRNGPSEGRPYFYVSTKISGKTVLLHRLLTRPGDREVVDHRNHDPLDNRRENLRVCSHAQNMRNRLVGRNSKSGVKGVYLNPRSGKYRAEIRVNGKSIKLGSFSSVEEAASAYRAASIKYHGEFGSVG